MNAASRSMVALALTVTLGLAAFPHPQDAVEVPFEYSRAFGLMLIKVEVNGKPYSGTGVIATAFLSIGSLNPKNCQIFVVDLSALSKTLGQEVDGILGMSVLKEFEIVSADLRHHKLVLK